MNDTDHDLVERTASGDPSAFDCLVLRWEPRVRCVLRRLAGNSPVDDLTQDVFLRVLKSAGRYRRSHAFSTWLYRIVNSVHCDYRRRTARWRRAAEIPDDRAEHSSPHDLARKTEVIEMVDAAIDRLPTTLRTIIVLKHFANLTFREIALVLNEPVSTVKSRGQTALRKLNTELSRVGLHQTELES